MAALFGGAAVLVLTAICIVAALAAWLMRGRSRRERRPLRVRPWMIVCEVVVLGALAAGAVAFGNYLSDVEYDPTVALSPQRSAATT